jgi:hypothetical protein
MVAPDLSAYMLAGIDLRDALILRDAGISPQEYTRQGSASSRHVAHASDCALHNAPAMEPGGCDCGPRLVWSRPTLHHRS